MQEYLNGRNEICQIHFKKASWLTCLFCNWAKKNSPSCHAKIFDESINTTKIVVVFIIIYYLFIISRALQGHSTDVQYNLTQNIFTVTT